MHRVVGATGQAFYGKLTIPDADTYLLSDVFYIVPNDTAQRLVKRGTEVFGPREPMVILARHAPMLAPESSTHFEKSANNSTTVSLSPADEVLPNCDQCSGL